MNNMQLLISMRVVTLLGILVADLLFVKQYHRRKHFLLRLIVSWGICLLLSALLGWLYIKIINLSFQINANTAIIYPMFNMVIHILIFLLSIGAIYFCYKEKIITILFGCIAGYATQNITNVVTNIFGVICPELKLFAVGNFTAINFILWLTIYVTIYIAIYFLFAKPIQKSMDVAEYNLQSTIFLSLIIIVVSLVSRSIASSYNSESPVLFILLGITDICCCFTVLYVQFLLTLKTIEKHEKDIIMQMQELKLQQYKFTKENIDIINIKCHDLKHQLLEIKEKGYLNDEYAKNLSDSISFYDAAIKTGNENLDLVLTDKNLYCVKNGIKLTVIADGRLMNFLAVSDIYSLFGNALDNAIEYVMTLPAEKRIVKLMVSSINNFVQINIRNSYEGPAFTATDKLPKTTKSKNGFHGFGMRSIKEIIERYGGNLLISAVDNQFVVSALFPLKN